MKKRLLCIVASLLLLILPARAAEPVSAAGLNADELYAEKAEQFGLSDLYDGAPDEVQDQLGQADLTSEGVQNLLSWEKVVNFLTDNLVEALKDNMGVIFSLFALLIVMAIYEILRDSFNERGSGRLLDFACAGAAALIVCQPFYSRVNELTTAATQMSDYMEISVPVLTSLLAASGNVTSATVLHLFLYNATVYAGGLFSSFLLPLAGTYICLGIASAVTENEGLKTMTLGLRTFVNRCIMILTVAFTGLLSLQTAITGAGDSLSRRALKMAVGSFLPVTGNIMSDSVDTLMSSLGIIKSVAGVFSIIVVFYLIVVPVIKMAVNFISLKLACFAGDILGSGRVRSMLSIIADGYSLLIAIACGLMAMFIVCIAILLKAGGSG